MVDNKEEQQQLVQYAEWQKTEDKYGNHYVVYQTGGIGGSYYVIELDEYLISLVIGPIKDDHMSTMSLEAVDLDDSEQLKTRFGCDMCDGHAEAWYGFNETCRHRDAVVTVLKRRRDYLNNNYDDNRWWVISFVASERRPHQQEEQELKAI